MQVLRWTNPVQNKWEKEICELRKTYTYLVAYHLVSIGDSMLFQIETLKIWFLVNLSGIEEKKGEKYGIRAV